GANERLGIAFLGCGGRAQAHLDIVKRLRDEGKLIAPIAVCDVWDGQEDEYEHEFGGRVTRRKYAQGLYPSAKKLGLSPDDRKHVVKDYRRLLELDEVDAVCIATPDHWHARMTIDACDAGKHVYCEKPMARTIDEAVAVLDATNRGQTVMTVGVQSMADPTWSQAGELIRTGRIGHIAQAQTSCHRNDIRGSGRYYRLTKQMSPKTIDWKMFLGSGFEVVKGVPLAPEMPFDRAVFGQWRCYWPFGGGPFTDLLVQQTTRLIAAMGVRHPARVTGSGGIFLEYDGRDVPDVASLVADYEEGCQLQVSATTISSYPGEEIIRGRLGAIRFTPRGYDVFDDNPTRGSGMPARIGDRPLAPTESIVVEKPRNETGTLWTNFLDCIRSGQRRTLCPPDLASAALITVAMGLLSYRNGQALFWDREHRRVVPADGSWANRWENRSHGRGTPNQIAGWQGGETGSNLEPPHDAKLAGPWSNGKDPAEG
ncbi:MAG: Gfo/Idh/MocA family oxidoreductase, partial [Planctomycetes bacterium]|nr:Gfo/Idh/MocA family oxidoreductase [Planctomycetota bacterium]